MSYDSDVDVILPPPVSDTILIDRTRAAAFDLIAAPPCILDADFLLDVVELGDRLQSVASDRDAALRSNAELTRERDGVMRIPNPTPDQIEYLEKLKAASSYDPNLVIGGPSNPCSKIFDHKWLDPNCVENGCQSLVLQSATAELRGALEAQRDTVIEECAQAAMISTFGPVGNPCCMHTRDNVEQAIVDAIRSLKSTALASSSTKETL